MEFRRIQNATDLFGPPQPTVAKPEEPARADEPAQAEKPDGSESAEAPRLLADVSAPVNGQEHADIPTLPVLAEIPWIHGDRPSDAAELGLSPGTGSAEASDTPTPMGEVTASMEPLGPGESGGPQQPESMSDTAPQLIEKSGDTRSVAAGGPLPAKPVALVPHSALFAAVSELAAQPEASQPGALEPKLAISWGDFHQGAARNLFTLLRPPYGLGPRGEDGRPVDCPYLRDTRVDGRIPVRASIAAALWHVAILALPISLFTGLPHRNPAFQNVEITWKGPIDDLPLLEIPREKPKPVARLEAPKLPPTLGADAFHPRQRIFTDPVRPTHPRQTLINPAAPNLAPKFLPKLPNMVLFQAAGPAKPRMQITDELFKKARGKRAATDTVAPQNAPKMEQQIAEMNLPSAQSGPARPKLELKAGAAPRVAQRAQAGDAGPAPDVGATEISAANGGTQALIAISANPAPPAPVQPPAGNVAARVSISPEGKKAGEPGGEPGGSGASGGSGGGGAGKSSVGVSISGGNPSPNAGGGNGGAKISAPVPRVLVTRPEPKANEDVEERTSPPDFAALPPGAKPEMIFQSRKVYTLNVNMPNLNSSTGSWILNFSEFPTGERRRMDSGELSGPAPLKKVDPKYPQTAIAERVAGEVVLYAVIRRDGSVDSIQLVRGVDKELDANAMKALAQWQFRPAVKQGVTVELEAIVHIPFRLPENY